jgi:hypothetical protein
MRHYFFNVKEILEIVDYMANNSIPISKISLRNFKNEDVRYFPQPVGGELTLTDLLDYDESKIIYLEIKQTKVINSIEDYENIENAIGEISGNIERLVGYVEFLQNTREEREERRIREEREEREERKRKFAQEKSDDRYVAIAIPIAFTILVFPWILIALYAMFLYFTFYARKIFKFFIK